MTTTEHTTTTDYARRTAEATEKLVKFAIGWTWAAAGAVGIGLLVFALGHVA